MGFFTKLGWVLAWILFVTSSMTLAIAVLVAVGTDTMAENRIVSQRVLGTDHSGEAIDNSLLRIGIAVALGILVEISRKLDRE